MIARIKYSVLRIYAYLFGSSATNRLLWLYKQVYTYTKSLIHPYRYDEKRYKDTFLSKTADVLDDKIVLPVPRIIYIFWTGDNEMSENRKRCVESIISTAGVQVKLITSENLNEYILEEHPLHPAYEYLSFVHRSDYLRCYFMNYYGGGYVDIKKLRKSWKRAFDKLNNSQAYLIGYPESNIDGSAWYSENDINLKSDLYLYWRLLLGNGGYICRPHTKFTIEWMTEINSRLDKYLPLLEKYPSNNDPYMNAGTNYPIQWTEICGSIFHPLCLKYNKKILSDKTLRPIIKDYR